MYWDTKKWLKRAILCLWRARRDFPLHLSFPRDYGRLASLAKGGRINVLVPLLSMKKQVSCAQGTCFLCDRILARPEGLEPPTA